jgi:hypothetical protein
MIDSGNALLMLKKWVDEETMLLFRFESLDAAFSLVGIASSASLEDCTVRSRKGDGTLGFRLDEPDCRFEFRDRRSLSSFTTVAEDVAEMTHLSIFFPARFSLEAIRTETIELRASLTISELHSSELTDKA